MTVLQKNALDKIKKIHVLSRKLNGKTKSRHEKKLLDLMRKHIDEIEDLHKTKNAHFLVETGDLIILCFEILLENDCSIDETVELCFNRYNNKIKQLLKKS
ncbi:MAG: hypothetical protein HQL24_04630 [Candidatus Omnitrophica bacterium]|nr:hypothetical protein [Candidatus Omnitrophota bacterium]